MPRPPLSAVLITRNADRLLGQVLHALSWCEEILVVDSGSTDRTLEIARTHGARLLPHEFEGYGPQKAWAVSQASHDWVLVVDGDEIVTPELRAEIEARLERDAASFAGFEIPISLVFLGRLMRHGGEYRMRHLRLYDRRRGNYNQNRVHERVELDGPVGRLEHHMLHDSYGSIEAYFAKFNDYTTAGAVDLAARGRTAGVAMIALRFPLTFIRQYLIRGHVLNGYPGFIWSLFSAMYPVVKYAKLREMTRPR
ncbi:MAG TPA: glycosyltransferase family 2 protein [Gemmatimonadaceae bacterium]|nr:glycosyltransferase family 2 protein [Gemmatimonadaceae bacterium]